jgi:VanZ family protein
MTVRGRRALCATLAAAWMAALFWASSRAIPFPELPPALLSMDKLLHALAFGVLAALLAGAFARDAGRVNRMVALAALVAAAYGATDEWHQSFVPGRNPDPGDLLADAVGASAGALVAGVLLRARGVRASIGADVGDPRI